MYRAMIVIWYGTIPLIPVGWLYCDGTNGTPNMTAEPFIYIMKS